MSRSGNSQLKAATGLATSRSKERPTLGRPLSVYRGYASSWGTTLLILGSSVCAVLVPLSYGLHRMYYGYTQYGPVAGDFWSRPWLLIASLALSVTLLLASYRFYLARRFVAVHKNGLRMRLGVLRVQTWLWTELAGISSGITQERFLHLPLRTYSHATLYPVKGKPVQLRGPMQDMPALVQCIKDNLYPRLLPRTRAAYRAGERLQFGPLTLNQHGLDLRTGKSASSKGKPVLIPWKELDKIEVQSGCLSIQIQNQQRRRFPISDIPNFEILVQLIQQEVQV